MGNRVNNERAWEKCVEETQVKTHGEIAVYTAIMGGYDKLVDPLGVTRGVDFICFTNNQLLRSDVWKIVYVPFEYRDPRRLAKLFKILPHLFLPNYKYSIWVDGSFSVSGDVVELLDYLVLNKKMVCFNHPKCKCIYDEANRCLLFGKDSGSVIRKQMKIYKDAGYPKKNGLISGGVLIRVHQDVEVKQVMEAWWYEIDSYSVRDQLSFNYVAWTMGFHYCTFPFGIYENKYFSVREHPKTVVYDEHGNKKFSLHILAIETYLKIKKSIAKFTL